MCGRIAIFSGLSTIAEQLNELLDLDVLIAPTKDGDKQVVESYNLAPSSLIPVARLRDHCITINSYRWGLIPSWAKDDSIAAHCFNARSETMATKPAFRTAFKHSRCIIPINGYFEWKKIPDTKKQPVYIYPKDGTMAYLAGLCEPKTQSATVITRDAKHWLSSIHDRQPVALDKHEIRSWLDPTADSRDLIHLITEADLDMEAHDVSLAVNNVRNNGSGLISPI